jgi:hypothetical protein
MIPLAEVMSVDELDSDYVKDITAATRQPASYHPVSMTVFKHSSCSSIINSVATMLKLSTKERGYNSGRNYFLQANSQNESDALLRDLSKLAEAARRKAEGRTRFQNSQDAVHRVLDSRPFTAITGLLLVTVNFMFTSISEGRRSSNEG